MEPVIKIDRARKPTSAQLLLDIAIRLDGMARAADHADISTLSNEERQEILRFLDPPLRRLKAFRQTLARGDNGYTCHNCGEVFQAARSDARFCSSACRQAGHRKTNP